MAEFLLRNISNPVVMAILNVTPDSFFSGSRWENAENFQNRVINILNEGAQIIDVGGYSSRPGAVDISEQEEFQRLNKAIEIIRSVSSDIPISIDTFRSRIVKQISDKFGKIIVNDISAGEADHQMLETVAQLKLSYIAMHMRGTPQNMQQFCHYDDIIEDIKLYFNRKIAQFKDLGINDFALDPGFGFAKDTQQNHQLLRRLNELIREDTPILVGVSRKSMIYRVLNTTPEESLNGTTAMNWEALRQGAKILRVHDVRQAAECVKLHEYFSNSYK